MRHMNEKENDIFDKELNEFLENGKDVREFAEYSEIQSLISKSNSYDRIVEHIHKDKDLYKKFVEIRDMLLKDGCQSTAIHICYFIDSLYEVYNNYE